MMRKFFRQYIEVVVSILSVFMVAVSLFSMFVSILSLVMVPYILFHQPISGFLAVGFSILWIPFGLFLLSISTMVFKWANSFLDKRLM